MVSLYPYFSPFYVDFHALVVIRISVRSTSHRSGSPNYLPYSRKEIEALKRWERGQEPWKIIYYLDGGTFGRVVLDARCSLAIIFRRPASFW